MNVFCYQLNQVVKQVDVVYIVHYFVMFITINVLTFKYVPLVIFDWWAYSLICNILWLTLCVNVMPLLLFLAVVFFSKMLSLNLSSQTLVWMCGKACCLCQPSTMTTFAKHAYRCSAPAVWKSLPKTVVDIDSDTVFKSRLKTFLFSWALSLPFFQ